MPYGTTNFSKNCSAIMQMKLPNKLKDPGSFTIPCIIREHTFRKALYDLGASINPMLLLVFKRLNLGKLAPTSLSLQMANRSMTSPKGIIEDVLIKVDKFIFPLEFVVLDMENDEKNTFYIRKTFSSHKSSPH